MSSPEVSPTPFQCVARHTESGQVWVGLSGELDLAVADVLAHSLNEAFGCARFVGVDLRQLTFMDSAGLAVLVGAHKRARAGGQRLVFIRGPQQVERLLEITGLNARLEFVDDPPPGPTTPGSSDPAAA